MISDLILKNFLRRRKDVIGGDRTAKELHYSDDFIDKLRDAKTDNDITRILAEARKEKYNDKD